MLNNSQALSANHKTELELENITLAFLGIVLLIWTHLMRRVVSRPDRQAALYQKHYRGR